MMNYIAICKNIYFQLINKIQIRKCYKYNRYNKYPRSLCSLKSLLMRKGSRIAPANQQSTRRSFGVERHYIIEKRDIKMYRSLKCVILTCIVFVTILLFSIDYYQVCLSNKSLPSVLLHTIITNSYSFSNFLHSFVVDYLF